MVPETIEGGRSSRVASMQMLFSLLSVLVLSESGSNGRDKDGITVFMLSSSFFFLIVPRLLWRETYASVGGGGRSKVALERVQMVRLHGQMVIQ